MDDEIKRYIAELEGKVRYLEARWAAIPWESMSLVGAFVPGSVVAINTTLQAFYAWLDANAPKEEGT